MSRNIYIYKFDPAAEDGMQSFPLSDVRDALKAISDPLFREWGVDGEDGNGGIETGEQVSSTLPDGNIHQGLSTDTFLFNVKNGQVNFIDWDRPCCREGTTRALWHLIETHSLSLIDPSGGGDYPMLYVPSEACLKVVEQVWSDCRKNGVHVFSGYKDFRMHFSDC